MCPSVATKVALGLFPARFSNTPNTRMPPRRCPWATRPIHVCRLKRLPLGAEGLCSNASKCKLPTTHNHHRRRRRRRRHHHYHLPLQLLLKVFVVVRAIFERWNPGAAENGAEDVLGFFYIAMKNLAKHAFPHSCPSVTREGRT